MAGGSKGGFGKRMRQAVVYSNDDIIQLLMEKHGVQKKDIIKQQYSFTVMVEPKEEPEKPAE